uniref:Uncharacterized protein n=1 Tax=Setaria viridis TaxID=4556 RepID=A0A4U6VUF1_SETVI|nr:hypothetical protein SEVIR_2G240233v2 [Setaria viridis]
MSVSKVSTRTIQILGNVHQWNRFCASWQHTTLMFTLGSA